MLDFKEDKIDIRRVMNSIICGDTLKVLKRFPEESVDLVITSPPYYGLRNYGVKDQIGLEETFEEYLDKMIEIMWEIKRVVKKTGQIWINMGDCYGGLPTGSSKALTNSFGKKFVNKGKTPDEILKIHGTKSFIPATDNERMFSGKSNNSRLKQTAKQKCLLMQPERFAIRCIDEVGLILRNKIKWCLDENTKLLVRKDNKYRILPIKDLEFNSRDYQVPALSKDGIKWVRIKDVWYSGKKEVFEVELTNGKRVIASKEHLFPTTVWNGRKKFIKLSFKKVKFLNQKLDKFYVATRIKRKGRLEGNYQEGLLVGWYLAEGSGIWTQNPKLTINNKDLKKQELQDLIKKWKLRVKKQKNNNAYDLFLGVGGKGSKKRPVVDFLRQFILGKNCGEKKFTDKIWNMSDEFLTGIIDGFLKGDGYYDKKYKKWRVRIKYNPDLVEQIETICLLIGKQFRKENNEKVKGFGKEFRISAFSIQDWNNRITFNDLSFQSIRNIKSIGIKNTYDLEVEPVYCGKEKNKPTKEKRKVKWNNIFFLSNGILTHNCKQVLIKKENRTIGSVMPTSVKDRFNESGEELYFFVKSKKYWSDLDAVRLPPQSELNFERPRMGQGNQTIYEQKRAPGIVRQRNYPESKYNKFNYRVRDAIRKKGQPQFRATEKEIKRYNEVSSDYGKKKKGVQELGSRWMSGTPNYVYHGKFAGREDAEMFNSPRARTQRNKTIKDPNAKGLRQAPGPGEPNAFNVKGKNIPTIWQIQSEPHNFSKELGILGYKVRDNLTKKEQDYLIKELDKAGIL